VSAFVTCLLARLGLVMDVQVEDGAQGTGKRGIGSWSDTGNLDTTRKDTDPRRRRWPVPHSGDKGQQAAGLDPAAFWKCGRCTGAPGNPPWTSRGAPRRRSPWASDAPLGERGPVGSRYRRLIP
jgi:hypothetical protein